MLNAWDSTDYISFEPAIPGRFRWSGPDELVFSPATPLNPATAYTAKIKGTVLKYSKYNSVSGGDKISFHTPLLELNNAQALWVGESTTTATPQLDLTFNYLISPDMVKKNLSIKAAPIVIKIKSINPISKLEKIVDISVICPNASQGLVLSKILLPIVQEIIAINTNTTYFAYFKIESTFSSTLNLVLKTFFDIKYTKSLYAPNAHNHPQNHLPITAVNNITVINSIKLGIA